MNDIMKMIGTVISDGVTRYRVLHFHGEYFILCQMDINTLELKYYNANMLLQQIRNGDITVEASTSSTLVDLTYLSEKELAKYQRKKAIMDEIREMYGPAYIGLMGKERKDRIEQIIRKYGISRGAVWKYIRLYLQSGCCDASLMDRRTSNILDDHKEYSYTKKTGRPQMDCITTGVVLDDKVAAQYEEALKEYKKGREMTLKNAYLWMLNQYYSTISASGFPILKPISERPTYQQFTYYCRKHITQEEKDIIKSSITEQKNAKRLLLGCSRTNATRPGWIVEADALEIDCSIVSELHSEQCVGRPILYMMIDVYTSAIVAFSISFENNSVLGLTNLMLNLAEDKIEYCRRYGLEYDKLIPWPSNFIPKEIRCDRGSDFKSDKFTEICNRLGIKLTLEPGGMGSMKGLIEQSFHQFQTQLRPELEHKGLITKRHDSNHHREAMLTLTDFTKLAITYVITHNMKVIEQYPMEKDMYKCPDFSPTPIQLWNYGCKKYGSPHMITATQHDQYIYNLMEEKQATLSRSGIVYEGLHYLPEDDPTLYQEMYTLDKKKVKYAIRLDARNVGVIYYQRNNQLLRARLNPDYPGNMDFDGMTAAEYKEYRDERKRITREGKRYNMELDYGRNTVNKTIIRSATKPRYASTSDLREARALEKRQTNSNNSIETHLHEAPKPIYPLSNSQTREDEMNSTNETEYRTPTGNMQEAMRDFFDEEM